MIIADQQFSVGRYVNQRKTLSSWTRCRPPDDKGEMVAGNLKDA